MPANAHVAVFCYEIEYNSGMWLRYNYRLYPTSGQCAALARAFGCARVVFNDGLRARQEAWAAGRPYLTDGELSARLTAAKAKQERAWLGEVSAAVLQQALADLNAAYRNFFASAQASVRGQGRTAPVPVPQGPQAGDPVHPQCPVLGHAGRQAAAAQDRGHTRALVTAATVPAVIGHCDQGLSRPVLRDFRRQDRAGLSS